MPLEFFKNMKKPSYFKNSDIPKKGIEQRLFQLKIKLNGISPPVWRRVVLSSYTYFSELHELIQEYFSWGGYHLHEFYFHHPDGKGKRINIMGIIDWDEDADPDRYHFRANEVRLCDVLSKERKWAFYLYDFGDNWNHAIILEKVFPYDKRFIRPICVGGKRAAPLEDSGGTYGFQDKLGILKGPEHEGFEEIINWMGKEYDAQEVREIGIRLSPKKLEMIFGPSL